MYKYILVLSTILALSSCEDIIDVNLNNADSRYVIDANIHNMSNRQVIKISQTVPFSATVSSAPVEDATVSVEDDRGRLFSFLHTGNGQYQATNFRPMENRSYKLKVNIGSEEFTASSYMNPYVQVDSLGVMEDEVFGEMRYSVNLKFTDPKDMDNYYKYSISVNNKPFEFARAFSDKFNDGLFVTHEMTNKDNSLAVGDSVSVTRYIIDQHVFKYWNELQSINPGSAAPANPTSNISNGALGYFSVSSAKTYKFLVTDGSGNN